MARQSHHEGRSTRSPLTRSKGDYPGLKIVRTWPKLGAKRRVTGIYPSAS